VPIREMIPDLTNTANGDIFSDRLLLGSLSL
jgi:hypothetical protein